MDGSILPITFVESDRNCNTYDYSTRAGVVRMTKDGGTTWSDLDPMKTLPGRAVNGIAFDPTNANRAFVAVSFYDAATPTKHSYQHHLGARPGLSQDHAEVAAARHHGRGVICWQPTP